MLGQVVIDDQRMFAVIPEVLADGCTGEGRKILHGRRIARGGRHHDAEIHRVVLFKRLDDACHG